MKKMIIAIAILATAQATFAHPRHGRHRPPRHHHHNGDFVLGALLGSLFVSSLYDDPYYLQAEVEALANNINEYRLTGAMTADLANTVIRAQAITGTSQDATIDALEQEALNALN